MFIGGNDVCGLVIELQLDRILVAFGYVVTSISFVFG
jgi:hypothetical protein